MTSTLAARTRSPLSLIAPLALATLATACGGGGGDDRDPRSVSFIPDSSNCLINPDIPGCGLGGAGTADDATSPADAVAGPVPAGTAAVEIGADLADVPGSAFYVDANNSARLQGPVIGDGTVFGEALSRSIPFRVETPSAALELLYMSVVPDGVAGSILIGVVENRSDEIHCFISLEGMSIHDTRGGRIEDSLDFTFVDGVVASSLVSTDTCMAPGTRAYVSDRVSASADDVRSFSATHLESSVRDYSISEALLEPVTYELDGDRLLVTVVNRGSIAVDVGFSHVYLLDEAGHPVWKATVLNGGPLLPGEAGVLRADISGFTGSASTVRSMSDFDPVR